MSTSNDIHYLRRPEIDEAKWGACIESAPNGLIYGHTFFLDRMADGQWDALVLDDYAAVMPLPRRKKFGFNYLYQPFCTPVLGVFGRVPSASAFTTGMPISPFLDAIPTKFKYWDIDLNETNQPGLSFPHATVTWRTNHLLHLNQTPDELERNYSRLARRMCKRAITEHIGITRNAPPADIIHLYQKEYGHKHPRVRSDNYEQLIACAETAMKQGNAQTYLATGPDGATAAFYLVLSDKKFLYSVMGGSTEKGKEAGAFYLLTDAAIKDHALTDRSFRFEGSDIPGIAQFDASFGSTPIQYPHLVRNNLPFPINLLK